MRVARGLRARMIGASQLLALAACESEAPSPRDGASADAPSTYDAGPVDGTCAIVPFDGQLAPFSCPLMPPNPPEPCHTGTCAPYCGTPSESAAAVTAGTACSERPLQTCATAMPGMTRYDQLVSSVEEIATACGLPSPGSGGGVRVWFEGGCATRVEAVRGYQPLADVRDCLVEKLRTVRLPCAQEFPCASVSHALD